MANPEVLTLLQQSPLLGCGDCAICSKCYTNCGPGNIGFDQDSQIISLCTQATSSTLFWGCVCDQPPSLLSSNAAASLANCPRNYPNNTLASVQAEFSNICVLLGYPAPHFALASGEIDTTAASTIVPTVPTEIPTSSTTSSLTRPTLSISTNYAATTTLETVLPTSSTATSASIAGRMGLSQGEVGAIVGGILGFVLLSAIVVMLYLWRRRGKVKNHNSSKVTIHQKGPIQDLTSLARNVDQEVGLGGRLRYPNNAKFVDIGGRLRYPNDEVTEGGRLGSAPIFSH